MIFGFSWIEIIGYGGSVLVALSMMMKSIIRLRWINLCGASLFATYGFIISAYPVMALNAVICIVDIYYILQMYFQKDFFEIFKIKNPDNVFLTRFLEYYNEDIRRFFPQNDLLQNDRPFIFFALRNMLPVGLFIGNLTEPDILQIKIDYVIPGYRDLEVAKYVYQRRADFFTEKGIKKLVISSSVAKHDAYLGKMGFVKDEQRPGDWFYYSFR